jgi:chorismate--pyruvate lyase
MKNLLELNWKNYSTLQELAVSTHLQSWLKHTGSFMQRLREKGVLDPRIHVLLQEWQVAEPWESKALNISPQDDILVREVLILSEKKYWMFARSIFPRQTLTGEEAALAHLKTRPLGSFLFNHPDMKRSEFAFTCLSSGMRWHEKVKNSINPFIYLDEQQVWSRYSLFHLQEKSLLLTEVFLPDIAEL